MGGWADDGTMLSQELDQLQDEGCRIPDHLRDRITALPKPWWDERAADALWAELAALTPDPDLAAAEPNDLAAIRALRPEGPRDLHWQPSKATLLDRLHGAWTARCVGCALGKPVEGIAMTHQAGVHRGRALVEELARVEGNWPLDDFFSNTNPKFGTRNAGSRSCRETISCMEPDDDIHYTLVGLGVLERHGPDFDWSDVAYYWTDHIPTGAICTAELQAIMNFWNRSIRWREAGSVGCSPAWVRRWRNPYREWIGGQIRVDGWAWAAAGKPELAAELAWRDAMWTHERNGIYGAMFLAAMQAAAFVESDPRRLVAIGMSEIPRDCRLAQAVRPCLEWIAADGSDWQATARRVEQAWPGMSPVHTINNALLCVIALLAGKGDDHRAITTAVACGMDTDCNGASVGSIVGAAAGRSALSTPLAARLNDRVQPSMIGWSDLTMLGLAQRHAAVWQRVEDWYRSRS